MCFIFILIDICYWYVIVNFCEIDLKNICLGIFVMICLMSDSGKIFEGKVDLIGYGVLLDDGGLVLGGLLKVFCFINWVCVVQCFLVKIMVDKFDLEMFCIGVLVVVNFEL